jgi:hypothetical protein
MSTSTGPSRRSPPARIGPVRAGFGTCFAIATVLLVNAAFSLNNLAPYLGLDYAGAMTMYSGLVGGGDNHLLLPKFRLSDANAYVSVVRVEAARDRRTEAVRVLQRLATPDGQERPLVHLNLVRYQVSRACAAAQGVPLKLALLTETGRRLDVDDACTDPALQRYAVLSSYPVCKNRPCRRVIPGE